MDWNKDTDFEVIFTDDAKKQLHDIIDYLFFELNKKYNVNGSCKNDEDPVGRLMHDFGCRRASDMFYQELAKQVKYYKETEGGARYPVDIGLARTGTEWRTRDYV